MLDFIYLFIFMCMPAFAACLSVYLCGGQKVLDPLGLDLQTLVSSHVGAGN